jgi:hypothetical protein
MKTTKMSTEERKDFHESALSNLEYLQDDLSRIISLMDKAPIEQPGDDYEQIMLNIMKALYSNLKTSVKDAESLISVYLISNE